MLHFTWDSRGMCTEGWVMGQSAAERHTECPATERIDPPGFVMVARLMSSRAWPSERTEATHLNLCVKAY